MVLQVRDSSVLNGVEGAGLLLSIAEIMHGGLKLDNETNVTIPGWDCPPEYFGDGFACDCACGVVADPDCDNDEAPVFGCPLPTDICTDDHLTCVTTVPDEWDTSKEECEASYYNVRDGCDCECGTYDPDCDFPGTLWNCDPDRQFCNAEGHCQLLPPTPQPTGPVITRFPTDSPTTGWTCDLKFYGDGARCDCGCGIFDPDCAVEDLPVLNCAAEQECSAQGVCTSVSDDGDDISESLLLLIAVVMMGFIAVLLLVIICKLLSSQGTATAAVVRETVKGEPEEPLTPNSL